MLASATDEDPKTAMKMEMDLKSALKTKIEGGASRAVITDLLLALEAENPTAAPTKSDLLKGSWKFAYNGGIAPGPVPSPTRPIALAMYAGGFSPGAFGLAIASMLPEDLIKTSDFKLCIEGEGPYTSTASIYIEALGRKVPVMIETEIVAESDRRIKETYKSVKVSGNATEVPASLQYERVMFISYLDEDLMISRDETGAADVLFRVPAEEEEAAKEEMERIIAEDPIADATEAIKNAADDAAESVKGVVGAMDTAATEAAGDAVETFAGAVEAIDSSVGEAADDVVEAVSAVVEEGERPAEEAKEEEAVVVTAESFEEEEDEGKKGNKK